MVVAITLLNDNANVISTTFHSIGRGFKYVNRFAGLDVVDLELPLAAKCSYTGQCQSVRQHMALTGCRTIRADNGFADTFCRLAYAKLTFVS